MTASIPARVSFWSGVAALGLVVLNQTTATSTDPSLERAAVLASFLAVALMLVGVLWTRAIPETAARVDLKGAQGLVLAEGLPDDLAEELGWGSQMLLTASAAAVVLVSWQGRCLLRRGLLAEGTFVPGAICQRAQDKGGVISLVDLRLYPGREEFSSLLPGLPAVVVQPLGRDGLVVLGGWSPRCFSRSDLTWLEGWSQRIRGKLEALSVPLSGVGSGPAAGSSGFEPDSRDC
ncbi:cofactor assembly of complex C subunit B [Cyanobium sp. FACHB-13342]|uniref:cofactor assembly of complex C subunit B n=1 Tax=Cyanobium sp. FACHB-13342 TaxID=2692793 RepID=UPI0016810A7E|nr:cofactor assembly of complex C subunit B [Cyanobium sp. FACHB-13342]MBD2423183.1 cofactor assembly of complex C subunit B [Cyanobium sp. FACHB-13342]